MQIIGATDFSTRTRSSQELGKWFRCLAWSTNAVNLPGLEVIKGCSPHRALRPLREPLSGGHTCLFVLGAAGGLPFATPFVQLFVPVFSSLETSMGHDSSLSKSMENWLTHGGVVEGEKKWWKIHEEPRGFGTVSPTQRKTSSAQRTVHFIDLTRFPITSLT